MKKALLVVAFLATTHLFAEVSAFGAGNIVGNSYGLTPNEQALKERLEDLNNAYLQTSAKMDSMNERIEGLQQSLEGINLQYSKSNSRLNDFANTEANLSAEIANLHSLIEQLRQTQEKNDKQIRQAMNEFSQMMNTYIAGANLQPPGAISSRVIALDNNDTNATQTPSTQSSATPKSDQSWKNKSLNDIMDLALKEFKSNSTLADAKEKFTYLLEKNHRPARANFYLGEIEYKEKNYQGAINFYKKSTQLYNKGDHMPILLYHTAISLDKVGDTKNANSFYKALKQNYPDSPQAKAAPNRK